MLTTTQAFEHLAAQRNIASVLGLEINTWKSYKLRFKRGELSTDKMEEILQKAGFKVVVEKQWGFTGKV